jgi:hypothetical protein
MAGPVFSEMLIAPGTILYKGLPVPCNTLLKDTRTFYLTDDVKYADQYGKHICSYRVKKQLRLFEMTHENLEKILKMPQLKPMTRTRLRMAFGTGVTLGDQVRFLEGEKKHKNIPKINNLTRPGERASWKNLNHMMGIFFSQEFLIPMGYDGYYAESKRTVFHSGEFRSEIMLFNAYQRIERHPDRLPVVSMRSLKFPNVVSRLFLDYSRKTKYLIRPTKQFVVFCTGGQAVNLYLRQRTSAAKHVPLIRRTTDYDFSFALAREPKTMKELRDKGAAMRRFMTKHMIGFVKFINSNYKGANVRLRMKQGRRVLHPGLQVPATKRRTYLVYTWQLKIGKDLVDVADTALSLNPGITRQSLSRRFSQDTGIPIQQIKYQTINALGILSGSFLYKTQVAKRNPLTGSNKNKGAKNVARANQLTRVIKKHAKNYPPGLLRLASKTENLLNKISRKNIRGAKIEAATVNALVKNLVV